MFLFLGAIYDLPIFVLFQMNSAFLSILLIVLLVQGVHMCSDIVKCQGERTACLNSELCRKDPDNCYVMCKAVYEACCKNGRKRSFYSERGLDKLNDIYK